jgi:hypothetical protein
MSNSDSEYSDSFECDVPDGYVVVNVNSNVETLGRDDERITDMTDTIMKKFSQDTIYMVIPEDLGSVIEVLYGHIDNVNASRMLVTLAAQEYTGHYDRDFDCILQDYYNKVCAFERAYNDAKVCIEKLESL